MRQANELHRPSVSLTKKSSKAAEWPCNTMFNERRGHETKIPALRERVVSGVWEATSRPRRCSLAT